MSIIKALADENRLRMVLALRGQELCACQMNELFGLAASTISKHLSILYQAGLVNSRKEGRWIYYSLPGKEAPAEVRRTLAWICECLADQEQTAKDAKRLKEVLKSDPTELCKRQWTKKSPVDFGNNVPPQGGGGCRQAAKSTKQITPTRTKK